MCLFPAHDFSRGNKNIIQILLTVSTVLNALYKIQNQLF